MWVGEGENQFLCCGRGLWKLLSAHVNNVAKFAAAPHLLVVPKLKPEICAHSFLCEILGENVFMVFG
jgi:hypothetical protein